MSLKEEFKQNNTFLLYELYDTALSEEPLPGDLKVKIARSNLSQNFTDTAKTMDLTCLCLQINNTVVFFFQSSIHQTYKEIQGRKHLHSKPKVHQANGVIPFFVSHSIELGTFIVE